MSVLIGADPEVFVTDGSRPFISGHSFVFGTKEKPQYYEGIGHIQNDGMALEFNVMPAASREEFVGNTQKIYNKLKDELFHKDAHARVVAVPVAEFGAEYINMCPREATQLGCNPDFNAWTAAPNDTPNGALPFRTGSGHIHIGFLNDNSGDIASLSWDKDKVRRELYGKAGAFRPKPYGLEYRVLSNAWLRSTLLMGHVYDRTLLALEAYDNDFIMVDRFGTMAEDIINNSEFNWKLNPKYSELVEALNVLEGR